MGRFIKITIHQAVREDRARQVARVCPVDIFTVDDGGVLATVPDREDECLLCGQCVAVASDVLTVARAYGARRPVVAADRGGFDG
jgi:NAD-dependent dihydropyrimidine dehydrogenase PreA subunit